MVELWVSGPDYFPELVEDGMIGHENILRRELYKCKVCYGLL